MMSDACLLSYKLSLFCTCDRLILVAQKSCLLMAAAVDMDRAREATDHSEQVELLTKSLNHIQLCQEIWRVLQSTGDFSQDPTEVLLLLYEFEIRAKLNDPRLETVVEAVWELPMLNLKTLETIAHLSMEAPAYYPTICKRALQGALSLHKKQDPMDITRFR
ncbi:testis-expressed sequence 11 [Pelobates cultripes]|uniref:Testis-expressed sequence 11 n=2 Tax=Pelobates cultripes TaxID=61616 RepID=A0AAD1T5K6_PELCU|nr:testis-expressed sequence 11 [Pelobates cultripes]